jgi:hypothetical protein
MNEEDIGWWSGLETATFILQGQLLIGSLKISILNNTSKFVK